MRNRRRSQVAKGRRLQSAHSSVQIRSSSPIEDAVEWPATGLESQGVPKGTGVRFLHPLQSERGEIGRRNRLKSGWPKAMRVRVPPFAPNHRGCGEIGRRDWLKTSCLTKTCRFKSYHPHTGEMAERSKAAGCKPVSASLRRFESCSPHHFFELECVMQLRTPALLFKVYKLTCRF